MFLSYQVKEEININDILLSDSGCSNHMTSDKELFSNLDSLAKSEIILGDDYQEKALEKGLVTIVSNQDWNKDILNVYYVRGLKRNFICVG